MIACILPLSAIGPRPAVCLRVCSAATCRAPPLPRTLPLSAGGGAPSDAMPPAPGPGANPLAALFGGLGGGGAFGGGGAPPGMGALLSDPTMQVRAPARHSPSAPALSASLSLHLLRHHCCDCSCARKPLAPLTLCHCLGRLARSRAEKRACLGRLARIRAEKRACARASATVHAPTLPCVLLLTTTLRGSHSLPPPSLAPRVRRP